MSGDNARSTATQILGVTEVLKIKTVDLADFDGAFAGGATFDIHLTPSSATINAWSEIREWLSAEHKEASAILGKMARQHAERTKEIREDEALDAEERIRKVRALQENFEGERDAESARLGEIAEKEYNAQVVAWCSLVWLNIPLEDARAIYAHLQEHAPQAWDWLLHNTHTAIGDFRRKLSGN